MNIPASFNFTRGETVKFMMTGSVEGMIGIVSTVKRNMIRDVPKKIVSRLCSSCGGGVDSIILGFTQLPTGFSVALRSLLNLVT